MLGGVGDLVPQLQCGLEVLLGVGEGVGGLRLQARLDGGWQGAHGIVRLDPVVGEPGRHGGRVGPGEVGVLADRAGEGGVQPGTLAGQQLGVQRFLGQRMPEGVGLGDRIGDEDVVGDGGAQRGEQLCLGQLGDRGQQPVLDGADAAAATRSTAWVSSGRTWMRVNTTFSRRGGRPRPSSCCPAATSSSAKKALPCERS